MAVVERFGRYVLLQKLAAGGMGEVFRAAAVGSAGFAKPLAIKRILPHLAQDQGFVNMLIDEAKITAALVHPNILQVLDLGQHQGSYFLAMEFVAGQPLNRVIAASVRAAERLPHPFAFHIIMQALHGLAYAHEKRDSLGRPMEIIHRDISPHNLMVGYDGSVRLADFGIAKAAQRISQDTVTGSIKGKPGYMSPEVVLGDVVKQSMDIYAMGVVLHEMLTMKRMRQAETEMKVLLDVARGNVPTFEEMGADVPHVAAQVVYRALAPAPDDRWPSAAAMASAMSEAGRSLGWDWDAIATSSLMLRLFPVEIEAERKAENTFSDLIAEVAAAGNTDVSGILDAMEAAQDTGFSTPSHQTTRPGQLLMGPVETTPPLPTAITSAIGPPNPALRWGLAGVLAVLVAGGATVAWQRSQAGGVVVQTNPSGATVTVNGTRLAQRSPAVVRGLDPGAANVEVTLEGFQPFRAVVDVPKGDNATLHVDLVRDAVPVQVDSKPPGATLRVDGHVLGKAPQTVMVPAQGQVTLEASLEGHAPVTRKVGSEDGDMVLSLARVREAPARGNPPARGGPRGSQSNNTGQGFVRIQSTPWARVFIDGQDTGQFTPVAALPLSAGRHKVKLVNEELGASAEVNVNVVGGKTVKVSRTLR